MADIKRRTPEELRQAQFNYFIALDIDANSSDDVIRAAIDKLCQSAGRGDYFTNKLVEYQKDMRQVLLEDATYDVTTDEYKPNTGAKKREVAEAKQLQLNDAMKIVKRVSSETGTIDRWFFRDILALLKYRHCTPQELENEFEKWNIDSSIQCVKAHAGNIREFDRASVELSRFGYENLYDYLGVQDTATEESIDEAMSAACHRYIYTRSRAEHENARCILGSAALILLNPESRKYYDCYLKTREKIWNRFASMHKLGLNTISTKDFCEYAKILETILKSDMDAKTMLCRGLQAYRLILF